MSILEALKLKDAQQAKTLVARNPTSLPNLAGAMKAYVDAWPARRIGTDCVRASQLFYLCPREFVFDYFEPRPTRSFDVKSRLMMGCGTFLHEVIQNEILGPMGVLKGNWVNLRTKQRVRDSYHPDPDLAVREASREFPRTWEYEEYQLFDSALRISGHLDGIVSIDRIDWLATNESLLKTDLKKAFAELDKIPLGEEAKLEIKTTGDWLFQKMKMPGDIADNYKMQSNVYQKLSGARRAIFWYVNRNTMGSKMLPYWFEKHWWDHARQKAVTVWEAIRDLKLPERFRACDLPTCTRAKSCVFRELCFRKWGPTEFEDWALAKMHKTPKTPVGSMPRQWLDLSNCSW